MKLKFDELLSDFAFKFNLRRYIKGTGPVIMTPLRDLDAIKTITKLEPEKSVPFVGESLGLLRQAVVGQCRLTPD